MREFLEVVRSGSISAASREFGLPRATLSRRMSGLEADLGVRLMHRRTNRLVLTAAGEELRRCASRVVSEANATWVAVRRLDDVPRGLLRVSVTGAHFPELFNAFLREFPEVQLEVQSTTRHVDLLAEGVDVAVRIGDISDSNLIARRIHADRLMAVAAPSYLEAHREPQRADELAHHDCIVGFAGNWAPSRSWPLMDGGKVTVHGRFATNEIELVRTAALEGLGIALLPSAVVAGDLEDGNLAGVLIEVVGKELPVSIVYADREFIDPKVRAFIDRAAEVVLNEMPKPYHGLPAGKKRDLRTRMRPGASGIA